MMEVICACVCKIGACMNSIYIYIDIYMYVLYPLSQPLGLCSFFKKFLSVAFSVAALP